jgi:hypothetical protein
MFLPPGNPAKCPACGGSFPVEEGLAVGMPMRKLVPGSIVICCDCWELSTSSDGVELHVFNDADIARIGRASYDKVKATLAKARNATHGAAKA